MRKLSLLSFMTLLALGLFVFSCASETAEGGDKAKSSSENSNSDTSKSDDTKKENNELIPVEVTTIKKGSISNYLLLSSNLETEIMADVYARAQGIVEAIYKEEGQYVTKGEVMLSLEAEEYELAERRANVQYQQEQSNYKRLEEMHNQALLSNEEFEKAKFNLKTAEITWQEAKLNLDFMKIKSPISGRVGERLAKIGERIQPTDKLFSVVNSSQMIAVIWVPEKSINQLKTGQLAYITSDHLAGVNYQGWIKRISPVVDPSSGTFKVTVGIKNVKDDLRPGMFVNVHIIIDTHDDVVLIPKTAVVYEKEYMNVYVVRDSLAHKIRLKPGFQDNEKIESLQDVKEGDKVIVVGQAGMKDKTKVRIVSERQNTLAMKERR
ncbi:MAG: efflux RND transporter periplasmic adaptor subunit [Calditrichaceae bacterium]